MKAATKKFSAIIKTAERGGAFVEIPFRVEEVFGKRGRVAVNATFDGVAYRGSLAPMGGYHVLGVLKSIREQLGKEIGDTIKVTLAEDTEERVVEISADLQAALNKNKAAKAIFAELAYTHKREYVMWIDSAKRAETRARRIAKAVEMIAAGHKEAWVIRLGKE